MEPAEAVDGSAQHVSAAVYAGGSLVYYWRGGHGAPVLLAQGPAAGPDHLLCWRSTLSAHFRVFAPAPAGGEGTDADQPLSLLLQRFMDGLGLERVAVVADAATAGEVLWLALSEPERVERILIVLPPMPETVPAWPLLERLEQADLPLLIARGPAPGSGGADGGNVWPKLFSFLAGDG